MKKFYVVLVALVLIASAFTVSLLWNVSDEGVAINFDLPVDGTKGSIKGLKAQVDFDKKNLAGSKISATVEVKTLTTGNEKRDAHLLTADFFDAEKFPRISFVSKSIASIGDTAYLALGSLTIKDSVKTVEIPFSFVEDNNKGAVLRGTLSILAGDYGVMKKNTNGRDKVNISIVVPLKK